MATKQTEHRFILTAKDKATPTVKGVKSGFRGLRDDLETIGGQIGKLATPILAAGAAGAGALAVLTAQSFKSADALGKFSDRLGVASQNLAGLRFAAEQTAGVGNDQFDKALQRMTRRVSEAAQGTGEAVNALKELNIDAAELNKLSPDQQFSRIADAMKDIPSRTDQVRVAFKLFDSEGVGLVNTLDQGSEGLRQFQAEADSLGIALNRMDIAKIEQANDAVNRVKKQAIGFANSVAVAAAPALTALANGWIQVSNEAGGSAEVATNGMDFVVRSVGFVADAVRGLKVVWLLLRTAVAEVTEVILTGMTQIARMAQSTYNAVASITPGLDEVSFGDKMQDILESFRATNADFRQELNLLANAPMPSSAIERFYSKAKQEAEEAAIELGKKLVIPDLSDPDSSAEGAGKALKARLDSLNDFLSTEEERLERSYQKRQAIIDDAFAARQISDERYFELSYKLADRKRQEMEKQEKERKDRLREQLETVTGLFQSEEQRVAQTYANRHDILVANLEAGVISKERFATLETQLEERKEAELNRIAKNGLDERARFASLSFREQSKQVVDFLTANTQALARESKTWFEVNKALAATQAGMNTYEAVTKTLASYPAPLNFGLAAVVAANGFAQVRQIMSSNFNGKGGASAPGPAPISGGGASTAQNASQYGQPIQQAPASNVTFNITGSGADAETILQVIKDFYANDGVLAERGSAQYQEFRYG